MPRSARRARGGRWEAEEGGRREAGGGRWEARGARREARARQNDPAHAASTTHAACIPDGAQLAELVGVLEHERGGAHERGAHLVGGGGGSHSRRGGRGLQ